MSAGAKGSRGVTVDYLRPSVPASAPWHTLPVLHATQDNLEGYGMLVDSPAGQVVEIVQWPKAGGRPVDAGTGDEAGTVTGEFSLWWEGDLMFGENSAVGGAYLLGWSDNPASARRDPADDVGRSRLLLWHANYHPDGGQLFFPVDGGEFLAPLALPGDDVTPADFVAFHVDGGRGLYIHPGVWHEAVFPCRPRGRFHDEQGAVHARVSVDFPKEFGVFLELRLTGIG